jgi:hypothetical protein
MSPYRCQLLFHLYLARRVIEPLQLRLFTAHQRQPAVPCRLARYLSNFCKLFVQKFI